MTEGLGLLHVGEVRGRKRKHAGDFAHGGSLEIDAPLRPLAARKLGTRRFSRSSFAGDAAFAISFFPVLCSSKSDASLDRPNTLTPSFWSFLDLTL